MSALPRRNSEVTGAGLASGRLVEALTEEAAARARVHRSDAAAQAARAAAAESFVFDWTAEDGRDLEVRVFFRAGEQAEVLAHVLERVEDRSPTTQERCRYEQEFAGQLESAGDVWIEVASHIWERSA